MSFSLKHIRTFLKIFLNMVIAYFGFQAKFRVLTLDLKIVRIFMTNL